ncbi:hypothetical protein [Carboxylicivirga taeanensis]|uniref:hypothetical protein n=1 Tax=Carboxylicivirga taeanensis TaxID=1416875 RepID=UPI003F6E07BA
MAKQKAPDETRFIDNAKDRMMMVALIDKLKDVALFILVAVVLTLLVIGLF